KRHQVKMQVAVTGEAQVLRTEMRPENFFCLLQILATNSLEWLRAVDEPRIRVQVSGDAESIDILFSNNGPGIPPDLSTRIFEPLVTRKEGGRGMGLTIARQLVEAHGGLLYLSTDQRHRGANFQILLPRKRPRATIY